MTYKLIEMIRTACRGMTDHLFRTFLTALGIIFGVAAVIAMVAIGAGAEREALEELKRFGINSIRINSRPIEGEGLREAIKKLGRGLSLSDIGYLQESCAFLERIVPERLFEEKPYCLGRKATGQVVGVGDGFLEAARFEVSRGRFFDGEDFRQGAPVVVLGFQVARELFGQADPVGAILQIGQNRWQVIGVMAERASSKGRLAIKSRDHDRDVYLPLSVAMSRLFKWPIEDRDLYHEISALWITVNEQTDILAVRDLLMKMLKRRHREVNDLEALVPIEILQQSQKTQELFNLVMALIAGISLLVGGIGIMNIMLATVNERTREIGIRRAMGATQTDIVIQFLSESALISVAGGLIGILLGIVCSRVIAWYTGWLVEVPVLAVLLAFTVSLGVGVGFGLFPAWKASRLDPITALRYE